MVLEIITKEKDGKLVISRLKGNDILFLKTRPTKN